MSNIATNKKTVRELGGEIWSEITRLQNAEDTSSRIVSIDFQASNELCDLVMGVLARHVGTTITNDEDLPVTPLKIIAEKASEP